MNLLTQIRDDMNIKVLNSVEDAILKFGRDNDQFVRNAYQFFANKLGYKSKNYLYRWFQDRDPSKIGLCDIKKIIEITKNQNLADIVSEEIKNILKSNN